MKNFLAMAMVTALLGCATTQVGGDLTLEGRILDDAGSVYDNVEIHLVGRDGEILQSTFSGGGGVFTFPGLRPGTYLLRLDVENQMDGPIPAQQPDPLGVTLTPEGVEGGNVVFRLISTLSSSERLFRKYAADMAAWDSENTNPANRGAVVFTGSSSIRLWTTLARDFPGHRVLNRGFGGSTAAELRLVLDKVLAVQPTAVVVYQGDNDLAPEGTQVEDFQYHLRALTATLAQTIRKDRILILSIKPSRTRAARWPVFARANAESKRLAEREGYTFVDISTPMLLDGKVNDLYIARDGLHMSAEGYALWKSIIGPVLQRVMSR